MPTFEISPYAGLSPAWPAATTWLSRSRSLGGSHGCNTVAAITTTTGRTTARYTAGGVRERMPGIHAAGRSSGRARLMTSPPRTCHAAVGTRVRDRSGLGDDTDDRAALGQNRRRAAGWGQQLVQVIGGSTLCARVRPVKGLTARENGCRVGADAAHPPNGRENGRDPAMAADRVVGFGEASGEGGMIRRRPRP